MNSNSWRFTTKVMDIDLYAIHSAINSRTRNLPDPDLPGLLPFSVFMVLHTKLNYIPIFPALRLNLRCHLPFPQEARYPPKRPGIYILREGGPGSESSGTRFWDNKWPKRTPTWANFLVGFWVPRPLGAGVAATPIFPPKRAPKIKIGN